MSSFQSIAIYSTITNLIHIIITINHNAINNIIIINDGGNDATTDSKKKNTDANVQFP
jgi:hypothetical protein